MIGLAVILLGGLAIYYGLTGNDPIDALRRALTGMPPAPPITDATATSFGGATADPRIVEPHGGKPYTDPNADTNRTGIIDIGKREAARYGWTGRQWDALYALWMRESGWNPKAVNASSGAEGIPQKISGFADNVTARGQILWGLAYIKARYGTPVKALQHSNATGWY